VAVIMRRRLGRVGAAPGRPAADVDEVELTGAVLSVRLLGLGAATRQVLAPDRHGRPGPVHLSLPTLADHDDPARNPYLGATVGRWANRIAGAAFHLDGRRVELVPNQGRHQLHGGPVGFDRHVWDLVDAVDAGRDGGQVTFRLVSDDGDQGFPGRLTVHATYRVAGPVLGITYEAETTAPTVVNLTHHGYWNLDGTATVADHRLALRASRVLPVDRDGIPTGGLVPVDGTPFDLRRPKPLGAAMAAAGGGFDHCLAVDGPPGRTRAAAVLHAPASGRWMALRTDQPGLQLYTGNGLPFRRHGAVCLEAQRFPDAPNRPELGDPVLRPGERYVSVTELTFGTGPPPALEGT
jgi:aldose 1-epimerase